MAGSSNDILIAVLGVTGAGKTTFVSKATGRTDLEIGGSLRSCTQSISISHLRLNGQDVKLIDTPGFDDSERSDANILESIAQWLRESYAFGKLLTGVILLQPIDGNRFMGSERRRTRLFENVLGEDAYNHVIIGATMWDHVNYSEGLGKVRQRQQMPEYWGSMVSQGAEVCIHNNTSASAHTIISKLLDKSPIVLQMQRELERGDGKLSLTSAGQYLQNDLNNASKELWAELQELRSLSSQYAEQNRGLREELAEVQSKLRDILNQERMIENDRVEPDDRPAWIQALSSVGTTIATWLPIGLGIAGGSSACAIM